MDQTPEAPNAEPPAPEAPLLQRTRCEVYSRVVGYLRPTAAWNKGKRTEFADRQPYDLPA